jgi:hypothetical protein
MRGAKVVLPFVCSLALIHGGCGDATAPQDQSNDRIGITNDAAALASRVTYHDDSVAIAASGIGYPVSSASGPVLSIQAVNAASIKLTLKAEVSPPSIDGKALQATSVSIVGDRAVVSYNMRGEAYLGAIDVFDISDKNKPVLRSEALFQNADINAVSTLGGLLVATEATSDTAFEHPAVVEVLFLIGNYLVLNDNWRLGLTSYAGTSSAISGGRAYVTSGDDGGLVVFDPWNHPVFASVDLHDARWVDVGDGKVVVLQGTPGQISVFDEGTMDPVGTFSFTGADIAESKSTLELAGGKAFIAAGTGGVQVLSTSTGTVVGSVPRPDPTSLGLASDVVVTNAVALDDNLLFISNGEAGVYVAQGSQNFKDTGSETQQSITMLGRLQFGSLESVNHVAFKDDYLIIAAGLGGLKIVKVN